MMVTFFPMYALLYPPRPARDPVVCEALCLLPGTKTLLPSAPEAGKVGLDHMDQCHITGRAHETSDPIQPALVEDIIRGLLTEQVQPDVKCGPVLDRRGRYL